MRKSCWIVRINKILSFCKTFFLFVFHAIANNNKKNSYNILRSNSSSANYHFFAPCVVSAVLLFSVTVSSNACCFVMFSRSFFFLLSDTNEVKHARARINLNASVKFGSEPMLTHNNSNDYISHSYTPYTVYRTMPDRPI